MLVPYTEVLYNEQLITVPLLLQNSGICCSQCKPGRVPGVPSLFSRDLLSLRASTPNETHVTCPEDCAPHLSLWSAVLPVTDIRHDRAGLPPLGLLVSFSASMTVALLDEDLIFLLGIHTGPFIVSGKTQANLFLSANTASGPFLTPVSGLSNRLKLQFGGYAEQNVTPWVCDHPHCK